MFENTFDPGLPLEITKTSRQALRRIRAAAIQGLVAPQEMQDLATETMSIFAKALLALRRPSLLLEADKPISTEAHLLQLNKFTASLFPDIRELNLTGNHINNDTVGLFLYVFSRDNYLLRLGYPQNSLVTLLSTGALSLAIASYLYEATIYVAAVDAELNQVVIPTLPDLPVVVVDDVVGRQATTVGQLIQTTGTRVQIKSTTGL